MEKNNLGLFYNDFELLARPKKSVSGNAVRFVQLLPYKLYQLSKLDSKGL